jgi:hypothetical protein
MHGLHGGRHAQRMQSQQQKQRDCQLQECKQLQLQQLKTAP